MPMKKPDTCSVTGCRLFAVAGGRCQMHYNRKKRGSASAKTARAIRTGDRDVTIVARCPKKVAAALFAYAKSTGLSRSLAVQSLIEDHLMKKW